jgi:ABC-type phosphate/phosphonate transport system substrate-binding protein
MGGLIAGFFATITFTPAITSLIFSGNYNNTVLYLVSGLFDMRAINISRLHTV